MEVIEKVRAGWDATRAALVDARPETTGRRWPRWLSWTLAGYLTALTAATAGSTVDLARTGGGIAVVVGVLAGAPLALLLSRPLLGWALSAAGAFAISALLPVVGSDPWPWPIPHGLVLLALLFAASARGIAAAVATWVVTATLFGWAVPLTQVGGWIVGVSAVSVIGMLTGRLSRSGQRLARHAEEAELEKARRVVLEERARIARDLHDVVAHHMSLVVIQAETAPYRVDGLSGPARAELASIGETARSALAETRALLTVLRGTDDRPEHAPQPGLDRLPELLAASRRAGVHIDADVGAGLDDLRVGTSLTAYRIVQEALANATRHGDGAPIRLTVRRDVDAVHVHVENPAVGPSGRPGHGITGMLERARAEGGELRVAHDGGRFRVDATLPIVVPR